MHHYVESIVYTCLESKNSVIIDHLFQECNLVGKMLQTDKQPNLSSDANQVDISEVLDPFVLLYSSGTILGSQEH